MNPRSITEHPANLAHHLKIEYVGFWFSGLIKFPTCPPLILEIVEIAQEVKAGDDHFILLYEFDPIMSAAAQFCAAVLSIKTIYSCISVMVIVWHNYRRIE